jgi:hypothetical protein
MLLRTKSLLGITCITAVLLIVPIFLSKCGFPEEEYTFKTEITQSIASIDTAWGYTWYNTTVEVFCISGYSSNGVDYNIKVEFPPQIKANTPSPSTFTVSLNSSYFKHSYNGELIFTWTFHNILDNLQKPTVTVRKAM